MLTQGWYQRTALIVVLLGMAAYYSLPSALYFVAPDEVRRDSERIEKYLPNWLPKETRFNLGIDLQGGLHLVMGVDTEKAVQDTTDRVAGDIAGEMKDKGKTLVKARRQSDAPEITFEMKSSDDWPVLKEVLSNWRDSWSVLIHSGTKAVVGMTTARQDQIQEEAVEQAVKTLRNRIDETGVKEPEIRRRGTSSILIQLAGLTTKDQAYVRDNVIGRTAQLEFKIVDETNPFFSEIAADPDMPPAIQLQRDSQGSISRDASGRPYLVSDDKEALKAFLQKHEEKVPADRQVAWEEFSRTKDAPPSWRTFLLDRRPGITGDFLEDAYPYRDQERGGYAVTMRFDRKGAVIFEKLTRENTGRLMAIVLDGVVSSAPVIQGAIPGGNARITLGGARTAQEMLDEAKSLSLVLKAGALPAPVRVLEERSVGATLGDDAVAKGKMALGVALVGVLLIMLLYYRGSGAVGVTAMIINLVFLFAALSIVGVTLTLPGIAGLALTIGMAVDANIIQFERIREEIRAGKSAKTAVASGFEKAFSAIFDANVTTLLACIVLGQFGSGPIRGFAITLGIGVIINTFTAVVVPRLGLDLITQNAGKGTSLSI